MQYTSILEWTGNTKSDQGAKQLNILTKIIERLESDGVSFGARTSRGYGSMDVFVQKREFDFGKGEINSADVLDEWLTFDPFAPDARWDMYSGQISKTAENYDVSGLIIEMEFKWPEVLQYADIKNVCRGKRI